MREAAVGHEQKHASSGGDARESRCEHADERADINEQPEDGDAGLACKALKSRTRTFVSAALCLPFPLSAAAASPVSSSSSCCWGLACGAKERSTRHKMAVTRILRRIGRCEVGGKITRKYPSPSQIGCKWKWVLGFTGLNDELLAVLDVYVLSILDSDKPESPRESLAD